MSRPTNWRSLRNRDIVRRNGGEDKRGGMPACFLPPPRPRPSKKDMRAETERLVADFEKNKAVDAFRGRARAIAERLKTNLIYNKSDAVSALWQYAKDNGVIDQIGRDAAQAILEEAGL
jgi:hypothetical protein